MSFTRIRYDEGNYSRDINQSTTPGNYGLNLPRNSCRDCFAPNLPNASYGGSLFENLVDVDSELMGLPYKQTKCPSQKFKTQKANEKFANSKKTHYEDCPIFTGENTRLSNPTKTLRSTGWNRWEWLCQNPQDEAIEPFTRVINTQLIAKDNHRPCIPQQIDPTPSMPRDPGFNNPELVMWNEQGITYPVNGKRFDEIRSEGYIGGKNCGHV